MPTISAIFAGILATALLSGAASAACDPPAVVVPVVVPPAVPAARTESYPDDPRLDVALQMLKKGSGDAAIMTARAVIKSRPDVDRAVAILGIALDKQKKYEDARVQLEKARDSKQAFPERKHVPHFLGWCCFHLGDLAAARTAFEAHLKLVPDEPDSTFGLALVALGEDKLDEADALFAKALKGFSEPTPRAVDQARVLTRMADLALRRDEVNKAEELLERAIKASALQHETWSKLARVRDRLGKPAEADAARANAQRILEALGRTQPDAAKPAPQAPAGDTQ